MASSFETGSAVADAGLAGSARRGAAEPGSAGSSAAARTPASRNAHFGGAGNRASAQTPADGDLILDRVGISLVRGIPGILPSRALTGSLIGRRIPAGVTGAGEGVW